MAKFTKQFAIINKIKSLVKRTGYTLFGPREEMDISEEIARKIQKTAYDLSHQAVKETKTPTYLVIAEQLQVEEDQIFRAAVLSLANIAFNEEKNARNIIAELSKYAAPEYNKTEEEINYVASKIDLIKARHKIEF